ncbi:hypothetical protein ES707_21683 [subsurface metagenome]
MSIIRVKKDKNNPYLIMNKTGLNDRRLSLKSKGLLCYLLSKPDNWYIDTREIVKNSLDGRDSVLSAINELVKYGYMYKHRLRRNNGVFYSYNYLVYERPIYPLDKKQLLNPETDYPTLVKPTLDNPTLLINKRNINNKTPVTTLSIIPNNANAVKIDPSLEGIKEYTITLLYELGIKDHKFLLDNFYIGDIFEYVDWMLTFRSEIKNPGGFLTSALKGRWLDSIHTKHS